MTALLDRECQLTSLGDGAYERDCSRVWWGWEAQHGGYVLALAKTAMDACRSNNVTEHTACPGWLRIDAARMAVEGATQAVEDWLLAGDKALAAYQATVKALQALKGGE